MKKNLVSCWILVCVLTAPAAYATAALAQEAPPPRSMPRVPVSRETLQERREVPRQLQGSALVIDGEKLRIGDVEMHLFGVIPPQLAASFGPQARAALDAATAGQTVTCQIRDRDREGHLLATCHAGTTDLALDLLKRGLAVSARGVLADSDLLAPYIAAEEAAQAQKLGLWSIIVPATASAVATPPLIHTEAPVAAAPAPVVPPAAAPLAIKDDTKVAPRTDKAAQQASTQTRIAEDLEEQHTRASDEDSRWAVSDQAGFFERYQILIAGLLMLGTALSIMSALWAQKRRDKSDEIKAISAALRGELMAARGVCLGRSKAISSDEEDRASSWPRIRSTLYGAYVGRIGLLGAELARQVASIYGQSSDYAALYNPTGATAAATPKKQALENLIKHIDEVMPKLAILEQAGSLSALAARSYPAPYSYTAAAPTYRSPPPNPVARTVHAETPRQPPARQEEDAMSVAEEYAEMPQSYTPPQNTGGRSPLALWESVRGFIQNHRNAIVEMPHEPAADYPPESEVSEYAALIEAEMARYRRQEQAESLTTQTGNPTRTRKS